MQIPKHLFHLSIGMQMFVFQARSYGGGHSGAIPAQIFFVPPQILLFPENLLLKRITKTNILPPKQCFVSPKPLDLATGLVSANAYLF